MNILSINGLSKTTLAVPLFKDVSLGIEEGEKIGLVGKNGAGKSTFLKIVAGVIEADDGTISIKRGINISMLPQLPQAQPGMKLVDFLYDSNSEKVKLIKTYTEFVSQGKIDTKDGEKIAEQMEKSGCFVFERRYASLCTEFGLPEINTCMDGMSGGMIKKAALARCLAEDADLLLLDEPTNHLDLESIELLEKKLLGGTSAYIVVTHDRTFLDSISERILEIERSSIFSYPGDYSAFVEMKHERWNALEKAENKREAILKIEMKWLMRGARARATKSERRKDDIKKMQESALVRPEPMAAFSSKSRRLGKRILELKNVQKQYDGRTIFEPFSYDFLKGDRIGVVGPNGCGKTTLLNIISGKLSADCGEVIRGLNTVCSYYTQTAVELPKNISMLDYIRQRAEQTKLADGKTVDAERLLEKFSFDRIMQEQKLFSLSGGELRRLQLVAVLAESPNLLILDEPTNDLDIETIELLESFVDDFEGCVITVSHDRAFLDGVTKTTIAFDGKGNVSLYPGTYSVYKDYLELEEEIEKDKQTEKKAETVVKAKQEKPKKATFAEKKEYETILDDISALEDEKAKLEQLFSTCVDGNELDIASKRYAMLDPLIEQKTARWEYLASLIGD